MINGINLNFKKGICIILVLGIIIGLFPYSTLEVLAEEPVPAEVKINEISISKKFYVLESASIYYLTIWGQNLTGLEVTYIDKEGKLMPLGNPVQGSGDSIVQYEVDPDYIGTNINIGAPGMEATVYYIGEENMPTIDNITPIAVKKDMVDAPGDDITVTGTNFGNFDSNDADGIGQDGDNKIVTASYYQGENDIPITDIFENDPDPSSITFKVDNSLGLQNIRFDRIDTSNIDTKITITYRYIDVFRIFDDLEISDDITMYPNRGVKGSRIYFKAEELKEDMSVFFVKKHDGTEQYTQDNKGTETTYKKDFEGALDQFSVIVPDALEIGEEYYIVFTNKVGDDQDPERIITKEKLLDPYKFTVISRDDNVQVFNIDPDQGPDTGQSVEINGKYFGTINISNLSVDSGQEGFPSIENNGEELVINYGTGTYGGKIVNDIKKKMKVYINSAATFEVGKNSIDNFAPYSDTIFVRTDSLTLYDETLKENVIVDTATTFTDEDNVPYSFEERIEFDGFTFIPSRITPTITQINPLKIMVQEESVIDNTYNISENIYLAIHGENFLIHTFKDENNVQHTRYPVINIGFGELIIDKNNNKITDFNGEAVEEVEMILLDEEGNILDGSVGHELGNKIIVKIPKGKVVTDAIVSTDLAIKNVNLRVTNPIRNTFDIEPNDEAIINFIEVEENNAPKITAVEPYIVTLDGGEQIKIIGSNFQNEVKVFIDGNEIGEIYREGNGKEITFTCPEGREGKTQLLVLNENGGIAVHDFIYVKTYTNPEVVSISPEKGMVNTLVVIEGDNFLAPDPTATGQTEMGMYKLIGTRVIFDDMDLNRYYNPTGTRIELQDYVAPNPESYLVKIDDGLVSITDYYYEALLQEQNVDGSLKDNFYTITVNEGEAPVLSDGDDEVYEIIVEGGLLKVKKENEASIDLTVTASHLEFGATKLRIRTPYEISEDEDGNDVITGNRVKVNNKKQIFVSIPILSGEGWYDVIVVNPDIKKVEIANGFYFSEKPMVKPTITSIIPSEGSTSGGYDIEITGENFEYEEKSPSEIIKSKVIIDGITIPDENVTVWTGGKKITVTIPEYPVNIKDELGLDSITVPVVVLNSDGGSDSKVDGFTYVTPTSHPEIWEINEINRGGFDERYLQIIGRDYRYYESFEDKNANAQYDNDIDAGIVEIFTDVNNNGKYDNYSDRDEPTDLEPGETKDDILAVLPKVYFGDNVAEIVEFEQGYILIKIPEGTNNDSKVYLVNNDHGVSNQMIYKYIPSIPKIDRIDPTIGTKKGKAYIELHGENFYESNIELYKNWPTGTATLTNQKMGLVRFDDISKTEYTLVSRTTEVMLEGGLTVEYNGRTQYVTVIVEEKIDGEDKKFERTFDFTHTDNKIIRYIDISLLQDKDDSDKYYQGYELIKIEIDDKEKTIFVERGYSPSTELIRAGQLAVWTPSYYTIAPKGVPVTLINPDGYTATAKEKFEYTNPLVDVKMTDIVDVIEKIKIEEGSEEYYIIESTVEGGITFTIEGSGFKNPLSVKIGGQEAEVLTNGVTNDFIRVRSKGIPSSAKVNNPLLITVEVEGVGSVTSADETLNIPIYYVYREVGGVLPVINEITPNKGSVAGGDIITIEGSNFAVHDSRYNVVVKIGDKTASVQDGSTSEKLLVKLPSSKVLGPVDVYVKNIEPLGETTAKNSFTYTSSPTITSLSPSIVHTTGGEKVVIKGTMFLEGVNVTIDDKEVQEVNFINENTIEILTAPIEEENTFILRVENTDGGTETAGIKFILPYPGVPTGFEANPGNERSIILTWNETARAERYKILASKEEDKNYEFLGETTELQYSIKDLEQNEQYYFKLWALNAFGSSTNYAEADTKTLPTALDEGTDKYTEQRETKRNETFSNGNASIVLPDFYTEEQFTIDLRDSQYRDTKSIDVTVPLAVARRIYGKIVIKTEFINTEISLPNIKQSVPYKGDDLEDTNVKIVITKLSEAEKARITKKLSRKEKAVSDAFSIDFILQRKKNLESFSLKYSIHFGLLIDRGDLDKDNLYLYTYNPMENNIEALTSISKSYFDYTLVKYLHHVEASVHEAGKFVIVEKK